MISFIWGTQSINSKIKEDNKTKGDRSFAEGKKGDPKRCREGWGKGWEGDEKRLKMYYVHEPAHHNQCNHYALQTWANKNKN